MTDISRFTGWWDQLPVDTRLKMNKADMEFAWISSSNAHQQGDKLTVVCPAWQLPHGLLVKGVDMDDALEKLEEKMNQYWGEA